MLALGRLVLLPAILCALTVSSNAAILAQVPQDRLDSFCHEFGTSHAHLVTFVMDDGMRLRGHVNCRSVTFTLSAILPPVM